MLQTRRFSEAHPLYLRRVWQIRISSMNARARKIFAVGQITIVGWLSVLEQFGGKCTHCGSDEYICIDHIIPLARGGTNTDNNIQPLCRSCNLEKSDSLESELYAKA